jgi:NADH-quinone oxidoreductase subunit H
MGFALFFLGESANIIFMCSLTALLFLGGWYPILSAPPVVGVFFFALKTVFILFCFIWVRVAYPRYRYDQLMRLGWKIFLPLSLAFLTTVSGFLIFFNMLPL